MGKRHATNFLIIGDRGTGKSSVVVRLLNGQSAVFYTFSPDDPLMQSLPTIPSEKLKTLTPKKHYKVFEYEDYRATLDNFVQLYRDGNIVYDDIRPIMKSNLSSAFEMLLTGVRHRGNDQWFIFQHTLHVPPFLCDQASHILLFKQPLGRKVNENLPRYDEVCRAFDWVQNSPDTHAYAYICTDIKLNASRQSFSKYEYGKLLAA